jgi:beta-galactosidase
LGAAVNKVALRRQFELLLEMGMNAVRTAHNVPAVEFMELADEMGIMVCSEIFDMWKNPKTTYDYARFFDEWATRDMAAWIRRDRNCPSVVMWSIGNEISDTHVDERGVETTKMLATLIDLHDPKGHAPATIGSNFMPWENARKCADVLKLAGYNYAEKYYEEHHAMYPDWIIYGSETASTVQSRGIYKFPLNQSVLADDDEQCSSLGNSSTSWGAKCTEACIIADRDAEFSLGQFIWTGFDYIGEPTPYHTKNSYLGQIDTAGFFKDSAYIWQAEWTDYKKKPMVHVFPYWDFSEGQLIDVRVTSNAPKVELFFNGNSLGTFNIDHVKGQKLVGDWQIPYKKGTLKAVAYNEHGKIIAEDTVTSFGDAKAITLKPNKTELIADGEDLIFIEIGTVDERGVHVANANNRVEVSISGAGRLIGLDNGDSTDYDSYKETSRRLFSGKLLAIVAANHKPGEIVMTVNSVGLTSAIQTFNVIQGEVPIGMSKALVANTTSAKGDEIPVRKIELISAKGNFLNENLREVVVKARIYPENATYRDLQWRVTNAAGIDSTIADLEILNDGEASVKALGDGKFYLRCMTNNGADKPRLISQLDFSVTGIGEAYLNPYDFISGGLYTKSNIELTNGNDRGVATDRELESQVGFEKVNFGAIGSDMISLPLFSLTPNEFPIEIWEGMPGETDSEKVCEVIYDLGSKWNTYQEKMYQLPRKFKGLTTICFVFKQKVHMKGFSFVKSVKAYEKLMAIDYSFISGDSYTVTDTAVVGIGNNVTLIFDEMDFTTRPIRKIQICGSTPLTKNTIQIRFNDGKSESIQMIEFTKASDYQVQEFKLDQVGDNQQVSFIFLPGCQFDFKWFKFS